jgi:hypothetical protein
MLVVDEAAGFKNLHMPQAREDGVPKFMGGGGDGSDRAWQLDFRAAAVRRRTGGAGIVLLTATPAKNSPLEFYNLIQFIDPTAFTRAGIRDPEQFIDRFLKIEIREVLDSTFEIIRRSAVTGFKNLEDLRTLIFRYGEFRTAEEVGLKLPRPLVETITIAMDEVQEAKYRHYVARIEEILSNPNPDSSPGNVILGLLARLSLIALHGSLEDGYTTAPRSPAAWSIAVATTRRARSRSSRSRSRVRSTRAPSSSSAPGAWRRAHIAATSSSANPPPCTCGSSRSSWSTASRVTASPS